MANAGPVLNYITNAMSETKVDREGRTYLDIDHDEARFSLLMVDGDNLAAFIAEYVQTLNWCKQIRKNNHPGIAAGAADVIEDYAHALYKGVASKRSEHGQFLQALLADKQETSIHLQEEGKSGGVMDRIKNFGGNRRAAQQSEEPRDGN